MFCTSVYLYMLRCFEGFQTLLKLQMKIQLKDCDGCSVEYGVLVEAGKGVDLKPLERVALDPIAAASCPFS